MYVFSGGSALAIGELCRTLIVDDELLIRQGIKHYINWQQEGFEIVGEASNGQEALELIAQTNPHIIMTDIVMPIMDGEELTRIVKEKYPHIEIIILSSFGEFEYVRSAFQNGAADYILKPKLEAVALLEVLKKAANRIPSFQLKEKQMEKPLSIKHIMQRLLSGYEINVDQEFISKAFPYDYFCLLGVDLNNQVSKSADEFQPYIKRKMETTLQTVSGLVHHSFMIDENILVFLLNVDDDKREPFLKAVYQLAESEPGCRFALSEEFADFSQAFYIYKGSLVKLLNYQFYFPNVPLLIEDSLPQQPAKQENFNLDWFTSEFKRKHFDSAFSFLRDHVETLSSCYTTDVFEFKAFLGNIVFNITILLSNMDYNVKEIEDARYAYFKSIDEAKTAGESVQLLEGFTEEAKKCINSFENQPENLNMKKLLEYIMDHYAEPLTLTEVAKHFHFNPSYLSSYFSTHNNEGFIEYLNKVRVEEASKLLIKGTGTISEISGLVGFSDHSYFCKVFKKLKGLSPSQYKRKQYLR